MKITKKQLRRIIREAYNSSLSEAGRMVDRLDQMSDTASKLSIIDRYDAQREEWLDNNSTSRSGRRLKKHEAQTRNGEALSAVARVYLEKFEPEISRLKLEIDNAMRAGDTEAIERLPPPIFRAPDPSDPPGGLAAQMRMKINLEDAGLGGIVGVARFSEGGILASIGRATARNKRILDVDQPLRQELLRIKDYLTMLNDWSARTLKDARRRKTRGK